MTTAAPLPTALPAELPLRIGARAIDVLIVAALQFGLGKAIGFGFDWLVLGALSILAYFVAFDVLAGATPGKLALGLRVIGPDGGKPSWKGALIREAFTVVGAVPFVGPIAALACWVIIIATIQKSPLRQGKHDELAGGTRVVRVPR